MKSYPSIARLFQMTLTLALLSTSPAVIQAKDPQTPKYLPYTGSVVGTILASATSASCDIHE